MSVSPTSTILVPDSDSSDSVVTVSSDGDANDCVVQPSRSDNDVSIAFWMESDMRFRDIYNTLGDSRIVFELSALDRANNLDDQAAHCQHVINRILARGYVGGFKVGLTFVPRDRFVDANYAYARAGYHQMRILSVHDNSSFIADLETILISVYRKHDRRGLVNRNGNALCNNVSPGGESSHHGVSPHFLYVVFKFNSASLPWLSRSSRGRENA